MKRHLIIALTALAALASAAPSHARNVLDLKQCLTDSTIVYPESFETDTRRLLEGWYMQNYTATDDAYTKADPNVTDEVIIARLKALPTVIEMPYNEVVRSYIDRYTKQGRPQVVAILGLSHYYEPIFEQVLEERGLPLELKYLPIIESSLDPNAVSRHGATGLWQFLLGTAKGLGLEVNSLVDERRDPYASSEKAADYLKDLFSTYGDWSLAIAAYNCGPGNVNKAIRRAGGDTGNPDFWNIYRYLSPETRGYVPAFIAANYVMAHHRDHGINPVLATKPLVTDTIHVSDRIHFNQISAVLDIPVDELRILNPQFRADVIPGTPDRQYTLILPTQQVQAYIMSEKEIMAYEADRYARREVVEPGVEPDDVAGEAFQPDDDQALAEVQAVHAKATGQPEPEPLQPVVAQAAPARQEAKPAPAPAPEKPAKKEQRKPGKGVTHKVAAGETIWSIAEQYGVTGAQVKEWNGLRRNAVRVGQQLRIEAPVTAKADEPAQKAEQKKAVAEEPAKKKATDDEPAKKKTAEKPRTKTHTVRNGESLARIADQHGITVTELKNANNLSGNTLHPGDKLTIPAKGTKSAAKEKASHKSKSGKSGKKGKKSKRR